MSEHKEDDQSVEEAVMKYVGSLSGGAPFAYISIYIYFVMTSGYVHTRNTKAGTHKHTHRRQNTLTTCI